MATTPGRDEFRCPQCGLPWALHPVNLETKEYECHAFPTVEVDEDEG